MLLHPVDYTSLKFKTEKYKIVAKTLSGSVKSRKCKCWLYNCFQGEILILNRIFFEKRYQTAFLCSVLDTGLQFPFHRQWRPHQPVVQMCLGSCHRVQRCPLAMLVTSRRCQEAHLLPTCGRLQTTFVHFMTFQQTGTQQCFVLHKSLCCAWVHVAKLFYCSLLSCT